MCDTVEGFLVDDVAADDVRKLKHVKKAKTFLTYDEVKHKLNSIDSLRDAVFLKLVYAALARVGEIVRSRYSENPALTGRNIELTDTHLVIQLLTEKTRIWRRVPVNREKESWLTEPIKNWAMHRLDEPLFNYSTRWGEKVFEKYFGSQNIHLLRHWRATHLLQGAVTGKPLDVGIVCRMGGWTNPRLLSVTYDHSVVEDYIDFI